MTQQRRRSLRPWLPWFGGAVGLAGLAWVLRRFELDRFRDIVENVDPRFLSLVPAAIMCEQVVRGWKWRQLLFPLRPIATLALFGTIMAGYLLAMLIPFGFGTIARSWLVARREDLKLSSVLATVAMDRLTDGVVFALLAPAALALVVFPDPTGGIRAGLVWGAAGSLILFSSLLLALAFYRRSALRPDSRLIRATERLPARAARLVRGSAASFAEGAVWPRQRWRGLGVVVASLTIKLLAATHFLWAGLAVGVVLQPGQYLFLIVFLGFLIILGHFARVAGSFIVGGIFALGLFGVGEEEALAMVLIVEAANLLSVVGVGALSLWRQGVALSDLRAVEVKPDGRRG